MLAQELRLPNQTEHLIGEPLPLVYETIICRTVAKEHQTKLKLAEKLRRIEDNEIHQGLMNIGWKNILTTNYDRCLESACSTSFRSDNVASESTYSLFRRRSSDEQSVWHIHGDLEGPRTMMLGLHQYAGYLQKLRHYLTTRSAGSPFMLGKLDWDMGEHAYSWADLFMRDHVHIVGFGMDYAEIALWWLISYKQRIKHSNKRLSVGKTTFYQFGKYRNDRRLQMMESLGVVIEFVETRGRHPSRLEWMQVITRLEATK
jgi:hypothetical protein